MADFTDWGTKDPLAVLDYELDWTSALATDVTITASTWAIEPAGLTVQNQSIKESNKGTAVILQGGDLDVTYLLRNVVTLSNGSTDSRTCKLTVARR